jgi:hypothetical protein
MLLADGHWSLFAEEYGILSVRPMNFMVAVVQAAQTLDPR